MARFGSDDEQPLNTGDLSKLAAVFGDVTLETGEMRFLRILDRNLFRHRRPAVTRALARGDDWLLEHGQARLSYHQVVGVAKPQQAPGDDPVPIVRWLGNASAEVRVDV